MARRPQPPLRDATAVTSDRDAVTKRRGAVTKRRDAVTGDVAAANTGLGGNFLVWS